MKTFKVSYSLRIMVITIASYFMIIPGLFTQVVSAQDYAEKIRINQIGFYSDAPKIAVIADNIDSKFLVVNAKTGKEVLRSDLSGPEKSSYSPHITRIADFSEVNIPGEYRLVIPGKGESYIFRIEPNVLCDLTKGLIKGFYFQRMSTPLLPVYAGRWARTEGHPDNHVIVHPAAAGTGRPAGSVISCPRGWYDAGDYNKYIVNSGITMGTLLSLYEDFPSYFDTLNLNIPESGDNAPDILNEVLWNLRWMFTMQDPSDGGVYNKVTNAAFEGFVVPSKAVSPRYMVPKGTAATLDFAAVMAQAARVFGKFKMVFPGLSDSCVHVS